MRTQTKKKHHFRSLQSGKKIKYICLSEKTQTENHCFLNILTHLMMNFDYFMDLSIFRLCCSYFNFVFLMCTNHLGLCTRLSFTTMY